jgi:AcrR family transcriptional regulator
MGKGKQQTLSREDIVRAALRLTAEVGLDGLSMRLLGDELGVWPMAVYHHVPNKKALISLVADAAVAEFELPEVDLLAAPRSTEDWIAGVRAFARATRAHYMRYPGLAGFLLSSGPPASGLPIVDAELAGLRRLGATPAEAARIYSTTAMWLLTQFHGESMRTAAGGGEDRRQRLTELASASAQRFPALVEAAPHFPDAQNAEAQFEYGLDLLLDGLHTEVDRIARRTGSNDSTGSTD